MVRWGVVALNADNHRQIGDPVRFARVIVRLVQVENPPRWFAAGLNAYAVFAADAKALRDNAD
jgi:hypothetical protein